MDDGKKIEEAISNLAGTSVAHLEPACYNNKVKTISGITKLFYFEWPSEGDYAGYIRAQCMPHIGPWSQFSPFEISSTPINKPTPVTSSHSISQKPWNFPISRIQGKKN